MKTLDIWPTLQTILLKTGEGLQSDADRAKTELSFRSIDVRKADGITQVASAKLSRLLHGDQNVTLVPVEPVLVAIESFPFSSRRCSRWSQQDCKRDPSYTKQSIWFVKPWSGINERSTHPWFPASYWA